MMKEGHGQTNQLHDILIGVHSTMHLVHPTYLLCMCVCVCAYVCECKCVCVCVCACVHACSYKCFPAVRHIATGTYT